MSDRIPGDYFEKLPDRIWQRIEGLSEHPEHMAPLLSRIDKASLYGLPEGYFNELEKNTVKGAGKGTKVFTPVWRLALAATVVLMIGFLCHISLQENRDNRKLAENDILEYYIAHTDQLDTESLTLLEPELNDLEPGYFEGLDDAELEYYLSTIIDEVSIPELLEIDNI